MNLSLRKVRPYREDFMPSRFFSTPSFGTSLFDDFFNDLEVTKKTQTSWPLIDISENEASYKIEAEVPGLSEKDLKVEFEKGTLTISGEKTKEEDEKKEINFHKREIFYGKFQKTFYLGNEADESKLTASLKNGVLTLTIPKSVENAARVIPITAE